jgi:hypothetical protein
MAVAAAALVAAGVAFVGSQQAAPLTERDTIMLGEFANATNDPVFDGTLREALAVQLSQSPFLELVPPDRLAETLRLMGRPPGGPLPHDVAREACERLNASSR